MTLFIALLKSLNLNEGIFLTCFIIVKRKINDIEKETL